MEQTNDANVTDKINPGKTNQDRRGLLKRILGVGFAVPVISTFTMDSLMAQTRLVDVTSTSNTTSNTTPLRGCLIANAMVDKRTLYNAGYAGPLYFHAHAADLGVKQTFLMNAKKPAAVTALCQAPPSRVTVAVTLAIENGGASAAALRHQHAYRPELYITSSTITVNGQKICDLLLPQGRVLPTNILYYPDLPSLLEDMAAGFATVEISGIYQGNPVSLTGKIQASATPVSMIVLTS